MLQHVQKAVSHTWDPILVVGVLLGGAKEGESQPCLNQVVPVYGRAQRLDDKPEQLRRGRSF
jgi:hypothetical protein